jgi:hypothetical protein
MASLFSCLKRVADVISIGASYLRDLPLDRAPDERLEELLLPRDTLLDREDPEDDRTERLRLDPLDRLPTDDGRDGDDDRTDLLERDGDDERTDLLDELERAFPTDLDLVELDERTERLEFELLGRFATERLLPLLRVPEETVPALFVRVAARDV